MLYSQIKHCENFGNVTFSSDEMSILSVDLNNSNLGTINLNKLKHLKKKVQQRVNDCSMASKKVVGLVHART